jgi:2-oxoisovalerate dehydrogenase E1 component beta subunit
MRICGYDTPFPLANEKYYLPSKEKCLDAVVQLIHY